MSENSKVKKVDISSIKWGSAPAPLLPKGLRRLWQNEFLPEWAQKELHLSEDQTVGDLGSQAWSDVTEISQRLEHLLGFLIKSRRGTIKNIKCFEDVMPAGLELSEIGWTARTAKRVSDTGIASDNNRLSQLTYGDLANIGGFGVRSILDFVCTLEGAMAYYNSISDSFLSNKQEGGKSFWLLQETANSSWSDEISWVDIRFKNISFLRFSDGTLNDIIEQYLTDPEKLSNATNLSKLITSIYDIKEIISEINGLYLEEQLVVYLAALSKAKDERLSAIVDRFGWGGKKPVTLEEAGSKINVTRERVRQIQNKILKKIPSHPVYMPKLEEALALLYEYAPISLEDAAALIKEKGLSKIHFHPESILEAAKDLNHTSSLRICDIRKEEMVIRGSDFDSISNIPLLARKLAGKSGVSNVFQVLREAKKKEIDCDEVTVRRTLAGIKDFEFLDEDWFWSRDIPQGRNRLSNVTRKILSVVSPQDIANIREGVRKNYKWRSISNKNYRSLILPPIAILRKFYSVNEEFVIDGEKVSTKLPLDNESILVGTEKIMMEVLRSSPTGLLDRKSFSNECVRRGINENTFSVFSTYSPILDHVDLDIWKLRGVQVNPAAIESIREANHLKPRENRIRESGWTEEGYIRLAVKLPALSGSMVLGCPSGLKRFLVGREFLCYSKEDGERCGTVKVTEEGTSYGYGIFTRRYGADEGDILVVNFDTVEGRVTLDLGSSEMLED